MLTIVECARKPPEDTRVRSRTICLIAIGPAPYQPETTSPPRRRSRREAPFIPIVDNCNVPEDPMFRAWTPPLFACVLTLLAGCDRPETGRETASAVTTDTAAASTAAAAGAVPISTNSAEARQLYLEARAVAEQLPGHEAPKRYEEGGCADPTFAMAHYQLAVNSATAKDFLE